MFIDDHLIFSVLAWWLTVIVSSLPCWQWRRSIDVKREQGGVMPPTSSTSMRLSLIPPPGTGLLDWLGIDSPWKQVLQDTRFRYTKTSTSVYLLTGGYDLLRRKTRQPFFFFFFFSERKLGTEEPFLCRRKAWYFIIGEAKLFTT